MKLLVAHVKLLVADVKFLVAEIGAEERVGT
jgi:hypothetical protein